MAAASHLWRFLRDHPPSYALGLFEFVLGGLICTCLFNCLVKFFSTTRLLRKDQGPLLLSDAVELSCKLVSAIFAVAACLVGILVLRDCGCISIKLENNVVKHYMCFGLSYFFYDIYAMFVVFKEGLSLKEDQSFVRILASFVQARLLLVAHHLVLPFLIFPIFMGGLKAFGGGDCLVAAGFLLEASTPFVSLRKILAILGMKKSKWYIANGIVMTLVFFCCRVIFFPVVYYLYSVEHGASILTTVTTHVPWICSMSMLVLFLPQLYWFGIMLKGGLKVIHGKDTKDD